MCVLKSITSPAAKIKAEVTFTGVANHGVATFN